MDANRQVFSQGAEDYDRFRPPPPAQLPGLLIRLAGGQPPDLVVDLGSGSGLSAQPWAGQARRVVGVEPNAAMLSAARRRAASAGAIAFFQAVAERLPLPAGRADIITCAQSFHWLEPRATLAEIDRVLRPGGVFAAWDYRWPPAVNPAAFQAYESFMRRAWELINARGGESLGRQWEHNRGSAVLRESGLFARVEERWLHRRERGGARRFTGLALTNGVIQALQRGLVSAEEIDLPGFERAVAQAVGPGEVPWVISYHLRVGIK